MGKTWADREALKLAKEKRERRRFKRLGLDVPPPKYKSMGLVDDDEFGSKPPRMRLMEV